MGDTTPQGRHRRYLWLTLGGVTIILAALYMLGWYLTGDRVPSGTTVSGVDIGGMSVDRARAELESELGPLADAPITLTYDGRGYDLDPAEAGLALDVAQTVSDAGGGRSWSPLRMADLLLGDERETALALSYDRVRLESAVSELVAPLEADPLEPSVAFGPSGALDVSRPVTGVRVDAQATSDAVAAAYLVSTDPVRIAATTVAPSIDRAAFAEALREVARPAVSGPVALELPGRTVDLRVADYADALSLEPGRGTLTPAIDAAVLADGLERLKGRVGVEPTDARVVLRDGGPAVVPAVPGSTIDAAEVAEAITPVLTETGRDRSAEVGESVRRPEVTTRDARRLQISEVVSSFVTYFPYAEYRNVNQGRAAELINGTVLEPGGLFSFNDTVGERTEANGFVEGFVISNGVFAEDLGGGVSQVVTTTYNAAFFAGLEDVEHTPHSFYIDRYPMGREATVAWPTVDLKFRNTTPFGVLIEAWVVPSSTSAQGEMHVRVWSTRHWDVEAGLSSQYGFTAPATRYDPSDGCVATTGYGGFSVDVSRTFRRPGADEVVDREVDHVTYTPADTVICSAPPG